LELKLTPYPQVYLTSERAECRIAYTI